MIMVWGMISNHIPPVYAHCPPKAIPTCFRTRKAYQLSCWFAGATVLTFLPGFKYHCPQQVSQSEDEDLHESFPEMAKPVSKIHTYANDFVFLLHITALPILQPTVHSSMCLVHSISVVLACLLFLQIGNTLWNCRHAWQWQGNYNMWAWLWVGQWVWPVEKWLDITPKTHIIFISKILYETCFSTHPVLNAPEYGESFKACWANRLQLGKQATAQLKARDCTL